MDVAAGDRVADAEEAIAPWRVAYDCLRQVRKQRSMVDLAEVDGACFEREVKLVDRRRAVFNHNLVRLLLDPALAVVVEENAGDPVARAARAVRV